jgi:ribosomal protein S18 acetylase RimI-like enzyme
VIHYRSFRNNDPPGLVNVWNQALTGRSAVPLRNSTPLEHFIFAKPYFDPAGLIIALEDGRHVGFVHAGFGPNANETAVDPALGVVSMLAVAPSYQRRGIGSELLRRSESYLHDRGARVLQAGSMRPLNPFYLGLYGGSDSPGFLASDSVAEPFLLQHGYQVHATALVLQRNLTEPIKVADARFMGLRRRFEVYLAPRTGTVSWYQESVLGPLELLEFRLKERATAQTVARATVWEMEGFSQRRNEAAVGIVDVEVRLDLHRQGLAKFLLAHLLVSLQEQYFTLTEAQVPESNEAGLRLYTGLGFQQVDVGRTYRKEALPK